MSLDRVAHGMTPFAEWVALLNETGVPCVALDTVGKDMSNEFDFWLRMSRRMCPDLFEPVNRRGLRVNALLYNCALYASSFFKIK